MTLAEFHTQISEEINQGTRLDYLIPNYVRRAARLIEQDYTALYMERFAQMALDVSVDNPRFLSWPEENGLPNIKALDFIRYTTATNSTDSLDYVYLVMVEPTQIKSIETNVPQGYWLTGSPDGSGYIVLDQVPDENMTLEAKWKAYTQWPTSDYSSTPYLVRNSEMLLLAQTMLLMAPIAEEPDWLTRYAEIWKMSKNSHINADVELRNSGVAAGYVTIPS